MAPRRSSFILAIGLILASTLSLPLSAARADGLDPVTSALPSLSAFATQLLNGQGDQLRGVYARDFFADSVVQQPVGEAGFVSTADGVLTQFRGASQFGATGLLAHNYLAGQQFSQLSVGQILYLVYGDGRTQSYVITQRLRYQALQPNSDYSRFLDLQSGQSISAAALFSSIYDHRGAVILQTCIEADGIPTWGRLFVIAEPYSPSQYSLRALARSM